MLVYISYSSDFFQMHDIVFMCLPISQWAGQWIHPSGFLPLKHAPWREITVLNVKAVLDCYRMVPWGSQVLWPHEFKSVFLWSYWCCQSHSVSESCYLMLCTEGTLPWFTVAFNKVLHKIWNLPYRSHGALTRKTASLQSIYNLVYIRWKTVASCQGIPFSISSTCIS